MKTNFKRYVLPSLLILALAGSFAIAQTFTKALQLSQDTSGAFGVDASNNLYLANKLMSPTGNAGVRNTPVVTGTATPTITGTDTAGTVTAGTAATSVIVTFGTAYGVSPNCIVARQDASATSVIAYTIATTGITMTTAAGTGFKINYWCTGTTS